MRYVKRGRASFLFFISSCFVLSAFAVLVAFPLLWQTAHWRCFSLLFAREIPSVSGDDPNLMRFAPRNLAGSARCSGSAAFSPFGGGSACSAAQAGTS